jgi:PTH1 family peptidyl-tRNA hydrolase
MGVDIDLIVGLGNPEPQYLVTRHNAGFWLADLLAERCGSRFKHDKRCHGDTCEIDLGGRRIRLLKPMTYMNDSGRAVAAMVHYFQIPTPNVLVAYDELDLEPGRARLKFGGSGAGHKGIASVVSAIGAEFWRLRIGIGHPGPGQRDSVLRHVLQRPSADDEQAIIAAVDAALAALPVLLEQGGQRAQNQLHGFSVALPASPDAGAE